MFRSCQVDPTRSKRTLLGAPGIATRSKDATSNKKLLVDPANKNLQRDPTKNKNFAPSCSAAIRSASNGPPAIRVPPYHPQTHMCT